MRWLAGTLSLLIGVAGWFYLFYSRAAHNLSGIEDSRINLKRIRLRRITAFVLLVLAVCFYAAFLTLEPGSSNQAFLLSWGAVLLLLVLVLVLGLIDLRYTWQFYEQRKRRRP